MKPNRKLFFGITISIFVFGFVILRDPEFGIEFSSGVLASGLIVAALGVLIIYFPKSRDALFGVQKCPSCHFEPITIKDKIKSAPSEVNTHLSCHQCGSKLLLHPIFYLFAVVALLLPVGAIILVGSILFMFVTGWLSMLILVWLVAKKVPLVAV